MPDHNAQSEAEKPYDLDERTARFGEAIVRFCKVLPRDTVNLRLIDQLTRSATSVGANYLEAEDAISRKDFGHRIALCRKEAKESKHWLRMIAAAEPAQRDEARQLWQEAKELNLIFGAILKKERT
ncbi:MAG: four helix bundle protein [Phycisphaeraceae bacterium]|nr:four helix bundle protein [Phycisphaeraceae bacterium]